MYQKKLSAKVDKLVNYLLSQLSFLCKSFHPYITSTYEKTIGTFPKPTMWITSKFLITTNKITTGFFKKCSKHQSNNSREIKQPCSHYLRPLLPRLLFLCAQPSVLPQPTWTPQHEHLLSLHWYPHMAVHIDRAWSSQSPLRSSY